MRPLCLVLLLLGCGPTLRENEAERSHGLTDGVHYQVRVDPTLSTMWVRACFEGRPPDALEPMTRAAAQLLVEAYGDQGQALEVDRRGRISLRRAGLSGCVRYEVDLEVAGWSRQAVRQGGDLLLTQALFLWRPERWDPSIRIAIEVDAPRGVHVSTPWPRAADRDGRLVFRPDRSVLKTVGNIAFVHSRPLELEVAGTRAEVAILDGPLVVGRAGVARWLSDALRAASTMYGRFHCPRIHLAVVPVGPGFRPVAFGLVRRGGGPSVMLLVHENADAEALATDWTAVHELSHLGLPRMFQEDRWIAEGFATYYQEVLRARAGLITPEQAWGNLAAGFERGRYAGRRGPLWRDAERMRGVGRIYWAGTAFVLDVDVRFRQRGSSLDHWVERLRSQWEGSTDAWHGLDVMGRIDRLFGEPLARPLAIEYGRMRSYPDTDALLRRLGVVPLGDRQVRFDDTAPLAGIRRAITEPLAPALNDESSR